MSFPRTYPHGAIETIADDVFMVRGSINLNPILRISRNMAIVREGDELTLVNPVRLNDTGLVELDKLGTVKHLLRLGSLHGIDDPFYIDRYGAKLWAEPGGDTYPDPPHDETLESGGPLPFGRAQLVSFRNSKQPEAVIAIDAGKGLLLTTDAIQHYGDYSYNNFPARLLMPFIGFHKRTIVGPMWLKLMTPEGGSLKADFESILELSFDSLLAAHGTFLPSRAHQAVEAAIQQAFA